MLNISQYYGGHASILYFCMKIKKLFLNLTIKINDEFTTN